MDSRVKHGNDTFFSGLSNCSSFFPAMPFLAACIKIPREIEFLQDSVYNTHVNWD